MMEAAKIKKYWDKGKSPYAHFLSQGVSDAVSRIIQLGGAFVCEDKKLGCIDEGTPGGIHLAGCGILLGEKESLRVLRRAEATGIESHEECGAAVLYAKNSGRDISQADKYARVWAEKLAVLAGIPYLGHIPVAKLKRPSLLHVAFAIYYDGTGKFDSSKSKQFPKGFIIDRRFLTPDYAKKEVSVAIDIAFGTHGFGNLFSEESPLILIPIGDRYEPEYSIENLVSELKTFDDQYRKKIKIDGFVAP